MGVLPSQIWLLQLDLKMQNVKIVSLTLCCAWMAIFGGKITLGFGWRIRKLVWIECRDSGEKIFCPSSSWGQAGTENLFFTDLFLPPVWHDSSIFFVGLFNISNHFLPDCSKGHLRHCVTWGEMYVRRNGNGNCLLIWAHVWTLLV